MQEPKRGKRGKRGKRDEGSMAKDRGRRKSPPDRKAGQGVVAITTAPPPTIRRRRLSLSPESGLSCILTDSIGCTVDLNLKYDNSMMEWQGMKEGLSTEQVASIFCVSRSTVVSWRKNMRYKGHPLQLRGTFVWPSTVYYSWEELQAFAARNPTYQERLIRAIRAASRDSRLIAGGVVPPVGGGAGWPIRNDTNSGEVAHDARP